MRIEFVLPYPPTVNTYWRRRGNTYFVSKVGERYRRDVALIEPPRVSWRVFYL